MHTGNNWGGGLQFRDCNDEIEEEDEESRRRRDTDIDRAAVLTRRRELDEVQQSWLLAPDVGKKKKRGHQYVDLGCVVCKKKALRCVLLSVVVLFLVFGLPAIVVHVVNKRSEEAAGPDRYSKALHKALLFFNAQKSGKLPKDNGIPWRGNSGLRDGSKLHDVKGGLVGGYYDDGSNIKYHFPMAFSMTLLSWSAIEYSDKYKALGEYDHVRDLISWGCDYLLLTFNSSAAIPNHVYSQVGVARNGTKEADDGYCWMRAEDMNYERPVTRHDAAPEVGAEMAAALASASIVFHDNRSYSDKLFQGAENIYRFSRDAGKRRHYSRDHYYIAAFYNSTDYFDEYIWSSAWLFYASGNRSYLDQATHPSFGRNSNATSRSADLRVFGWDNKLPGAELLLTRLRVFLNPGYPYEQMLATYHTITHHNLCSYFQHFRVFNFTPGGMILLNRGKPKNLQYTANAAFLASLYADYMKATGVPGFTCGPYYYTADKIRKFATSQVDYILGKNPMNMSYVVGYGHRYPRYVHHRGASIPNNGKRYSCKGGRRWRDSKHSNPNTITGAMVGGPDQNDGFSDSRLNKNYTEPSLAGNAGLVAALISLTSIGGESVDNHAMFSDVPSMFPKPTPPPAPWKP